MALDLSESDAAELQTYLAEKYNTPSAEWLEGLKKQFVKLQALLEQGTATPHDESDNDSNRQVLTASASRAAALPVVKLAYRSLLIGTDDYLTCYAFGTISRDTFEDIFWQRIDEVNSESPDHGIEVYSDQAGKFDFRFGSYPFNLTYVRWDELVRTYSNIIDAPETFLKKREGLYGYIQLTTTQQTRMVYGRLLSVLNSDAIRIVYYFLRACTIEQGTMDNYYKLPRHDSYLLMTQNVLCLMDDAIRRLGLGGENFTLQGVVQEIFKDNLSCKTSTGHNHRSRKSLPGDISSATMPLSSSILMRLRAQPLNEKMDVPHYIRIPVEYNGPSSILHGEFLAMVERQLQKLHDSVSNMPECSSCEIWPGRLVEADIEPSKDSRWTYVLGIELVNHHRATELSVQTTASSWALGVKSQPGYDEYTCFIDAELESKAQMCVTLVNSAKPFARQAIPGPRRMEITADNSESYKCPKKKGKKKKEKQEHSSNESSPSLREASDVIHRLRHDHSRYNIDDFKVGYRDRVTQSIKEKPVADWQTDTQHPDFIAEHRIEYFKKCSSIGESPEIIWDKSTKIDKIFYSGNSKAP